jgi:hypothetical protein
VPTAARDQPVSREELLDFVRPRHRLVLGTFRRDGRVQLSPVTGGIDADPRATVLFLSDDFGDEWVQVDGTGEVLDLPEALEPLCDYYRSISGEHPDWDEYREAMVRQGKVLLRITVDDWGPVSRGGFPPRLLED